MVYYNEYNKLVKFTKFILNLIIFKEDMFMKKSFIKKSFALILCLAMMISSYMTVNATETTVDPFQPLFYGDFEYHNEGNYALVYDYHGESTDIYFPSEIDGLRTVFQSVFAKNNPELTSITFDEKCVPFTYTSRYSGETEFDLIYPLSSFNEYNEKITAFNIHPDNPYYASKDGVVYNKAMTELLLYPHANEATSFTVPEGVDTIGKYAFDDCINLKDIKFPESIENVGIESFERSGWFYSIDEGFLYAQDILVAYKGGNHSTTTTVMVEDGTRKIAKDAFKSTDGLIEIVLPSSVKEIEDEAFWSVVRLVDIKMPEGLEKIGAHAFDGCRRLTEIEIPGTVKEIGVMAFSSCLELKTVKINEGVEVIGAAAFFNDDELESVTIPSTVKEIGHSAFSYCYSLKSITIPQSVTKIDYETFTDCASLTSIEIPDSVTVIGNKALMGCENLKNIRILGEIDDLSESFIGYNYNKTAKYEGVVIEGWSGTSSEAYANENGFEFVSLDDTITVGDVNADKRVDIVDVTTIQKSIAGLSKASYSQMKASDVQSDDVINIVDATSLQKQIVGLS